MSQKTKRFRVGILGNCCTHGEFVAAALQIEPQAQIVAGWEREPSRQEGLRNAMGMNLHRAAEEIIESKDIDVVALCCSPHEKADYVERIATSGKHIFLNKPMCESLDSARRIEQAVARHNVQLVFDIPVIRFHPFTAKLLDEIRSGALGRPIHYAHSWGFTFAMDFRLKEYWWERLDSPALSGGGEMTNMGCYAIDYMAAMWGAPKTVQAKSHSYWDVYRAAAVENFGQIVCDYGDFFAVLAVGKQPLRSLPAMGVAEALTPQHWHNLIEFQFPHANLTALPFQNLLVRDGRQENLDDYLAGYRFLTPFQQLVRAIETGVAPDSNAASGRLGVEVLMAAYRSIVQGGSLVSLPLADGNNPLVKR